MDTDESRLWIDATGSKGRNITKNTDNMKCRIVKQWRVVDNANTLAPRYVVQECSITGRWQDYLLDYFHDGHSGPAVFETVKDARRFTETADLNKWDEIVWECEDESGKE